jgi:DNA-binding transcriptional MocR family regulator
MIYMIIRDHEDWGRRDCYPSLATIARMMGTSVSTVQRNISKLVKAGLITMERRWNKDGSPTTYLFTVLDPSPAAVAERLRAREVAVQGGGSSLGPPSPQNATRGGSTMLPEQGFTLEQESLNEQTPACAGEVGTENLTQSPTGDTLHAHPDRQPCTHPDDERGHVDDFVICHHCYSIVNDTKVEEDQARAVCAA